MNATAQLPPQNKIAEEELLSSVMFGTHAQIDRVVATGIQPSDFSHPSHGRIYMACLDLRNTGDTLDVTAVIAVIERQGGIPNLPEWRDRIIEIGRLSEPAGSGPSKAKIVVEKARLRRFTDGMADLIARAQLGADPDLIQTEAQDIVERMSGRSAAAAPLTGLTHDEVLKLELGEQRELVAGLVPAGAVGTIAGVPETHKSWLAQAIAVRVARGNGWVLGHEIKMQGPVGYFWQDDSTREEAERVKLFEQTHANPANLPVQWFLNEGIQMPGDLRRVRATVEQLGLVLLVLDSYYNFLPGIDLKDEQAEQVVSLLKREISDATGCTVLIVDHMPWATDANRSRLRAYGGVFKNAATRFGIYIDAIGDKLHIEARGNNITGFTKRLAYWDPDTLELKLATNAETAEEDLKASAPEIAAWVNDEAGGDIEAKYVRAHFEISDKTLTARIGRLAELGIDYVNTRGKPARLVAREGFEADTDEQLDLDQTDTSTSGVRSSGDSGGQTTPEVKPHNKAKTGVPPDTSGVNALRRYESADLQGEHTSGVPDSLKGEGTPPPEVPSPPTTNGRWAEAEQLVREHLWMLDRDQVIEKLVDLDPMTPTNVLERLADLAEELSAG